MIFYFKRIPIGKFLIFDGCLKFEDGCFLYNGCWDPLENGTGVTSSFR
jgi:hypothetical protein